MRTPFSVSFFLAFFVLCATFEAKALELLGAGATFPYPLYSKMFYAYWKATDIQVNYQAIGSGGGQRQLINMTVDFGGSDSFMSDEALAKAPAEILHIPTCLGTVVLTYNLPQKPELRLTPDLIVSIFLGEINRWDDQRIKRINPEVELPDIDILVVHRSDGSGTTFVFTEYLSKVSTEWKQRVGRGKAVNWPTGIGAKGNPGVIGLIEHMPGTIGYTELGYTLLQGMPAARLQNRAGRFIRPTVRSASAAGNIPLPEDTRISLTNTDFAGGYPLSSFTWILVYREQSYRKRPVEKARELTKLLWWMTHEGQKYAAPLHYAALSEEAVRKAEKLIKSMTYNATFILQ